MTDGVLLAVVSAAVALTAVGVVITLATDDPNPSIVPAWLFEIVVAPVLGLMAYWTTPMMSVAERSTHVEPWP